MITCPRCGAENKPAATVCRMCATALDASAAPVVRPHEPMPDIPATVVIPSPGTPAHVPPPLAPVATGGKVLCPGCQAANDADWAFCQQCGTRLQGATPAAPAPPQPVWGAPTVVSPAPNFGPPPAPDIPSVLVPPVAAPPPPAWGAPTVVTPAPNFQPAPVAPPPPAYSPVAPQADAFAPTVVTPAPSFGVPAPPPTPAPPPPAPVVVPDDEAATAQVSRPSELSEMATPPMRPAIGGTAPGMGSAPPPAAEKTIVMSSSPVAVPPRQAKLHLIMEGGEIGETYEVRATETVIGRVDGDIKFPHDGYMSGRHARVVQRNGHFFLLDNNSRNGTFIRIHQEVELHPGDIVLIGKQLFRFETDE